MRNYELPCFKHLCDLITRNLETLKPNPAYHGLLRVYTVQSNTVKNATKEEGRGERTADPWPIQEQLEGDTRGI
jgi:hypothetical protein